MSKGSQFRPVNKSIYDKHFELIFGIKKLNIAEMKICPDCGGTGLYPCIQDFSSDKPNSIGTQAYCPRCEGKGKVFKD